MIRCFRLWRARQWWLRAWCAPVGKWQMNYRGMYRLLPDGNYERRDFTAEEYLEWLSISAW